VGVGVHGFPGDVLVPRVIRRENALTSEAGPNPQPRCRALVRGLWRIPGLVAGGGRDTTPPRATHGDHAPGQPARQRPGPDGRQELTSGNLSFVIHCVLSLGLGAVVPSTTKAPYGRRIDRRDRCAVHPRVFLFQSVIVWWR